MSVIVQKLAEMTSSGSDYAYLPIEATKKLFNMKVNLCARICEVGLPDKSRGSDYFLLLKIIDFSCPSAAYSVNIFHSHKENLPRIKSVGDVICLHQVLVKMHKKNTYFLFNKRFSSFGLYHGGNQMGIDPYLKSINYYTTDRTHELVVNLRTLPLENSDVFSYSAAGEVATLSLLKDIESEKVVDLVCKVLYVKRTSAGGSVLFIWDGTDTPPSTFQSDLDTELKNPVPLHPDALMLAQEILVSFPCVGTVLRVNSDKLFEDIRCGDCWFKIYNVYIKLQSDFWTGSMNDSSKLFFLSDENGNAKFRKELYDERHASKVYRMPTTSLLLNRFLTETNHRMAPFATLMDSLTSSQIPHRIKCVVRVAAACPWRGVELRSPKDGHYRIRLTLEDHTTRVHAYLFGKEAMKFFGGFLEPVDLDKKIRRLLGIDDDKQKEENINIAIRNPPWIKCILSAHCNKFGSRKFYVSGTMLID